jgi:hypothetical protein
MEGRQLLAEKKYSQACPKFEESQKLDPGIGTLFNLADCFERVGRTASAWARFLDVAAAAHASRQADRERVARERASKLEPTLPRLAIQVKGPAPQLRISKDGAEVGAAEWGTPVPVDPGEHVIEASAPGKIAWRSSTQVAASAIAIVTIPPLEDDRTAAAAPLTATPVNVPLGDVQRPVVGSGLGRERAESPSSGGAQRAGGYVVGALGVGGLATGVVFSLQQASKNKEAEDQCPTGTCPQAQIDRHTATVAEVRKWRTASIVAYATGGAALVTGIVLVLTAPKGSATSSVHLVPLVGKTEGGAFLTGTW